MAIKKAKKAFYAYKVVWGKVNRLQGTASLRTIAKLRIARGTRYNITHDPKKRYNHHADLIGERKCRAESARIVSLKTQRSGKKKIIGYSDYDRSFTYKPGQLVKPLNGPFDRESYTCSTGIHFFMTEKEARAYRL